MAQPRTFYFKNMSPDVVIKVWKHEISAEKANVLIVNEEKYLSCCNCVVYICESEDQAHESFVYKPKCLFASLSVRRWWQQNEDMLYFSFEKTHPDTYVNVTGLRLLPGKARGWGRYIVYKSSGVLPFRVGRTWFKLAVTSSDQFLPVVVHGKWTV